MFRFFKYFRVANNEHSHYSYYKIEATFGNFTFTELDNSSFISDEWKTINWSDFRALCLRISEIVEIKLPNERISNKEVITLFMELIGLFDICLNV